MAFYKYYYQYKPENHRLKIFLLHITKSLGVFTAVIIVLILFTSIAFDYRPIKGILSPLSQFLTGNRAEASKRDFEVFGFATWWTLTKLENVDFNILTTLAYFGIEVLPDGSFDTESPGYRTFQSGKATALFHKAQSHGTRVVLTLTQMDNENIEAFLDNPPAQEKSIAQTVALVKSKKIDGVNIDFEYVGTPDPVYKDKFTRFVSMMTKAVHKEIPDPQVTVSVYASSAKQEKMYDIHGLSENVDGVFVMAYDFATTGSDTVIPTSPLYGHKEGKYWYDISTAVEDFLKEMPKEKLILGLPWYGYDYPVETPGVKVPRHAGYYSYAYNRYGYRYKYFVYPSAHAETYANAKKSITPVDTGWDDLGKVGWMSYVDQSGVTRQLFLDDPKSLGIKYDFANKMDLGGVGVWALGFDDGYSDMWAMLESKFGNKNVADSRLKIRTGKS